MWAGPGSRLRTPGSQVVWKWVALAFAVYWCAFIAGSLANRPEMNSVGAAAVLAILGWAGLERWWVRLDSIFFLSLVAAALPLLNLAAGGVKQGSDSLIKHVSLCLVIALSRMLRLPPVSDSGVRKWLAAPLVMVLVISLAANRGSDWDGAMRQSGLFVNPNNLALIAFLFPLLIDPIRDPLVLRLSVHGVVAGVLALTGTSGAAVAYGVGLGICLFDGSSASGRRWRGPLLALVAVGLVILLGTGSLASLSDTRLGRQVQVAQTGLHNILDGDDVYFYDQARVLGDGSTSALWRLVHWRRALHLYAEGGWAEHLFGFGVGSSEILLGKLPHNEYLRMLLEGGLVGLALFLYIWGRMILKAPAALRWVGLAVAIYSISENNLDNFPFMSMLALCLSAGAAQPVRRGVRRGAARPRLDPVYLTGTRTPAAPDRRYGSDLEELPCG